MLHIILNFLQKINLKLTYAKIIIFAIISLCLLLVYANFTKNKPLQADINISSIILPSSDTVVYSSKSGQVYYYPYCAGLTRLNIKTRVTWASTQAAEIAGLYLASSCVPE